MTIDFISDLHLDKTRPEVNKYFKNYLDNINNLKEDIKFVKFLPNINDEKFYLCLNNLNDCNNKIYLDENLIRLAIKNNPFVGKCWLSIKSDPFKNRNF